ncbi:hypothetical protein BI364_08185 [Acidihalobacter yilgarnensis]|uniref:Uncharacterized protein n=1 Tax=Acidihalobacter yilgarnensis TaxID=2819280 RepID=A0A1D8IN99_9GAMM|nr:hypothetical protein BI364_08185 [Acidihalobacter yilgarnensis]
MFGSRGGKLGEILLPGASGTEILAAIGRHLAEDGYRHARQRYRVSAADQAPLIGASPRLRFLLLAQPNASVAHLEATLGISTEPLLGWSNETAAAEGASLGCRGDYADHERVLKLTSGSSKAEDIPPASA